MLAFGFFLNPETNVIVVCRQKFLCLEHQHKIIQRQFLKVH